jgi:hypothetical protein
MLSIRNIINSISPVEVEGVPVQETQQETFERVKKELFKHFVQFYPNQGYQTILCRYKGDKDKIDFTNPMVRSAKNMVFNLNAPYDCLMVAPHKAYEYDEFKSAHLNLEGVRVESFPDGTYIGMFYHPSQGKWMITTRSYVGGENSFRTNDRSFYELFGEAFTRTTGLTFETLNDEFNRDLTYSFVLQSPSILGVPRYVAPSLVLVEVRNRLNDFSLVDLNEIKPLFQERVWSISFPLIYQFDNWEQVDTFITNQPAQEQGLVFRYGEERSRVRNPEYLTAQKLLGNHSRIPDIYAQNKIDGTLSSFNETYPEMRTTIDKYDEVYRQLVNTTHNYYVAHHTRPADKRIDFSEIPKPIQTSIWNIHKQYLNSGTSRETRRQVKPNVVDSYFMGLTVIELGNVISYYEKYLQTF